jgi:hypothetical protein
MYTRSLPRYLDNKRLGWMVIKIICEGYMMIILRYYIMSVWLNDCVYFFA